MKWLWSKHNSAPSEVNTIANGRREDSLKQRFREVLEYIRLFEETQKNPKKCFTKVFEKETEGKGVDWKDWTDNNYFSKFETEKEAKKKEEEFQVFLASYDYEDTGTGVGDSKYWLKLRRPWKPTGRKPFVGEDRDLRAFLKFLYQNNPEDFTEECKDNVEAMVSLLQKKHIEEAQGNDMKSIQEFLFNAVEHNSRSRPSSNTMSSCYHRLYGFAKDPKQKDLYIGFGHVKSLYDSNKKKTIMVNGPLFEVQVDLNIQEGTDGSRDLLISPVKRARVSLNIEVVSILNAIGGNKVLMDQFYRDFRDVKLSGLQLGSSDGYKKLLKAAAALSSGGEFLSANDAGVHRKPNTCSDPLHVSDAWCVFARKGVTTSCSLDARKMLDDLENILVISPPVRALLSGPKNFSRSRRNSMKEKVPEEDLIYALPTSLQQEEVGERLFVEGSPVLVLEGPPG